MTDTTTPKPTQAEIEALVALLQRPHGNLTGGERQDVATALTALQADNAILRTEKHADAETIGALRGERDRQAGGGGVMGLSYDTARCGVTNENYNCPLKRHCLRRIDKGRPEYQSFTAFKGGVDCDGFIDAEGAKT